MLEFQGVFSGKKVIFAQIHQQCSDSVMQFLLRPDEGSPASQEVDRIQG